MSKKYDYKCPDCGELISFGDNFCKNCSCRLDWEDELENNMSEINDKLKVEEKDTNKKRKNANSNKKAKKHIKKNKITTALIFILLQSIFYIVGLITNSFTFNIESINQWLEFLGYNIFLIIGIIFLIKNKNNIKELYQKKHNLLIILLLIICLIISLFCYFKEINLIDDKNYNNMIEIKEIGLDDFYSIIEKQEKNYILIGHSSSPYSIELISILKELNLKKSILLYYIDIKLLDDDSYDSLNNSLEYLQNKELRVPLLLIVQNKKVISDNIGLTSEKELIDFFELKKITLDWDTLIPEDCTLIPEDCTFEKIENVKSIKITAESAAGVGDIFSKTIPKIKYRIIDNKIGDVFQVNYTLKSNDSRYNCISNWYSVTLADGTEGFIWGGRNSMYVDELK